MKSGKVASWWRAEGSKIRCEVCPRECKLGEGQRGFCYVRQRIGDQLYLTSYGRTSGFAADPIEKKPLYHVLPGSLALTFGTVGCNLSCKFCQNWGISKARADERLRYEASPTEIVVLAEAHGCRSIAFSYNDPTIFAEFAIDTAEVARERGLLPVAVTAGYISGEARRAFFAPMVAANIDLKSFNEDFYWRLTGAHLRMVLETIEYARSAGVWLELTTLVIPGHNDSDAELTALSRWVVQNLGADVPLHFSAFHPDWKMRDVPPTPPSTLTRAREIAQAEGLNFVYTGNVRSAAGSATSCPQCGAELIVRDWFQVRENRAPGGRCSSCGHQLSGIWG